ncbi:unnamed protein product [Closterium sp. NIES-53]
MDDDARPEDEMGENHTGTVEEMTEDGADVDVGDDVSTEEEMREDDDDVDVDDDARPQAVISAPRNSPPRGGVVPPAAVGAVAAVAGESRGGVTSAAVGAVAVVAGDSRGGVMATPREGRAGVPPAAAGTVAAAAGESRGGVTSAAAGAVAVVARESRGGVTAAPEEGRAGGPPAVEGAVPDAAGESSAGVLVAAAGAAAAAAGEGRGGATGAAAGAGTVAAVARGGGAAATATARPAGPSTCTLGSWSPIFPSCSPHGPFRLVLRPRAQPPPDLPEPPESSLTVLHDPLSDYLCASCLVVSRVLSALVTHPSAPLPSVSALVTTVAGFASSHRLDYAAHLVSGRARSPSFGGARVFPLEVLEDRQFELGFLAANVLHLCTMLLAPKRDPDALIYEEAEMASYRSTGTYVDAVPPPGLYKVKRPPGSPPVFKARYVVRGFSQQEGVDFFQTFAPTPKMTTPRVLLHIAAQRDYELHSLEFFIAFLQGSLHDQITLEFFPSSFDPSLFVRYGSTPFFVLVYVDDLIFATPDRRALASVKEELQRRHTCTDLGELQHYLGLQITRDRAARTITLTQSHMVEQILTRSPFPFSKVHLTPLAVDHGLTASPSDESFESSGPYPELVGCLMCLITCTRPDLAYPLSVLARFVAPGRHRPSHWYAAKRVAKYVASTSGMGLVLGGKQPVTFTGYSDSSWANDAETHRSTQGYSFSLGTGAVSWRSTWASTVSGSSYEVEVYAVAMAA